MKGDSFLDSFLDKLVVARNTAGELVAVGRCVTYCEAPTISIETSDGKRIYWRADLAEVIAPEDVAERIAPKQRVRSSGPSVGPADPRPEIS